MKYVLNIALLLMVITSGCGNEGVPGKQGNAAAVDTDSIGGTKGDFYKRLSGTIAGNEVVVQLHKYGHIMQGYYQYNSNKRPILLVSYFDTVADETYYLTEENTGIASQSASPHWLLEMTDEGAKGKWMDAAGNAAGDIVLKEEYPAGTIKFDAFFYTDTARLFKSLAYPRAYVNYGVLFPRNSVAKEANIFLRSEIAMHMDLEGNSNIPEGLRIRSWRYFGNYREDLKGMVDSTEPDIMLSQAGYQYNAGFFHRVLYNDDQWLVLEDATDEYTGGAHGTYSSTFQNLDLTVSKTWRLRDIILDTVAIRPFLQLAARDYFKTANSDNLNGQLLVEEVPVSNNVFITPNGLTFVYQPYEIASYANGSVQLFVPYNQIMPLLTPPFIARMGLEGKGGVAWLPMSSDATTQGRL